ncbi:Phospholipase A and acyltransferase 5 [Bulinus truncatus]|nr:Phospholipase A and acyltransferase 5 [Bulinus truncatus]
MTESARIFNERTIERSNKGDRLQIIRTAHSHWGVFIGENKIIHLWHPGLTYFGEIFALIWWSNEIKVREDKIPDVTDGYKVKKNNRLDAYFSPLPIDNIVQNAKGCIHDAGYNAALYNCEHFVNRCRYGFKRYAVLCSVQVIIFILAVNFVIAVLRVTHRLKEGQLSYEFASVPVILLILISFLYKTQLK